MQSSQRLGFVSTSRADAGIYRPLIENVIASGFPVTCFLGGTHGLRPFGCTADLFRNIEGADLIEFSLDRPEATDPFLLAGETLPTFAHTLRDHVVDLLFVLGDRAEMLTATMAAVMLNQRIAHLHGGDRTHGAYDDKFRDAISHLADLHFPALPQHEQRLRHIGIPAASIHCVGSLATVAIAKRRIPTDDEFKDATKLTDNSPFYTVLFHPETRAHLDANEQIKIVTACLESISGSMLILGVNMDVGSDVVAAEFQALAARRPATRIIPSLAPAIYYECLHRTSCLIGNSSSGIIEAASLHCPVVNIGDRQAGRVRGGNVIDVEFDKQKIADAIEAACAPEFKAKVAQIKNPYHSIHAADAILDVVSGLK